ncbi:MAG: DNA (cytosine-5-)-methyltransferase [Candidatus Marinimicrobia bacterium]|mgnify:CR=1|jgi:DNA (cytosine-5)-methyltransferase 1|nr:DNA (cytosine-5-)-methyltransferase [Candidatus Neomarinimicrobiota bacterium]MBT7973077.1 DNA (cytosine-5-)-methyltransferase [Candidatus Neomarinimicrobiota bacterium]
MKSKNYNVLSLFSGAGGLDLGFENKGFNHLECVEIDENCINTLKNNRPNWNITQEDITTYVPRHENIDVLIGGPPCQGFSLGGKRDPNDPRNRLFLEMIRVAKETNPRVVVIENVLNLRTMEAPWSGKNFIEEISEQFESLGYSVFFDVFRVCYFGVPQTRRRFIFIAIKDDVPQEYQLPVPDINPVTIREALFEIGQNENMDIPNHHPQWGFKSRVHTNLENETTNEDIAVPIRISRTGSDGHPIRSFDEPFPAVDTATVWGWAKGNLHAERVVKDRKVEKHVRNPDATTKLWRITADQMRTFTHREYARLQTFPDNWVFTGKNKRDYQKQIGNAVPVKFAERIAENVRKILISQDENRSFDPEGAFQLVMAL